MLGRRLLPGSLALGSLGVLAAAGSGLAVPRLAADPSGALATVAADGAWLIGCWLAVSTLVALAARIPGTAGRLADRVAAHVTPAVIRRAISATCCISLCSALPAAAANDPPVPSLDRIATAPPNTATQPNTTAQPIPHPRDEQRHVAPQADQRRVVVVAPGDSLWAIAARSLGPRATDAAIASAWPRWYAANRVLVGTDPGLIRPGQRLVEP